MQADPGQAILTGNQVFVERLVLMPQQNDTQGRHGWKSQDSTLMLMRRKPANFVLIN